MIEFLWLIPLGFVAGVLGSIIGLGGGIIVVPVLLFAGFSPTLAASNSLFAAFSNAVASSSSYAKQKRIEYSIGLKFGLLAIPGTIVGAVISSDVAPNVFKILFAVVLVASGIYILVNRKIEPKKKIISKQILLLAVGASFFAGVIASLFGIGGGVVYVPLMVIVIGLSMKMAAPTSQFILLFASASALITHTLLGHSNFDHAILLSIGAFAGGIVGARLSLELKESWLKILIAVVMVAAAVKLTIDSLELPF